ncbi:hypothetical protein GCM10027038_10100 [Arthrobacter bambusae]
MCPRSAGKRQCPYGLAAWCGSQDLILRFETFDPARHKVCLVQVVHGMQAKVRFNGGRVDVIALAGCFDSLRCQFESSKAEYV